TPDRMAFADDQVEDDHDHEADDRSEECRDDEEDEPEGRIHATALGVLVHPQGANQEGDDSHRAEAEDDENPSLEEHLERSVHPSLRGRTRLSLFHGCPGMRTRASVTPSRGASFASCCPSSLRSPAYCSPCPCTRNDRTRCSSRPRGSR